MHPSDEGTPTSGRPSQHPPHPQGDPGWPRVVGGIDCIESTVAPLAGPARFPWALCGALLLAVCAGAMLLSGQEGEKQIIRAGTEPVVAEAPAQQEEEFLEPPVPLMVQTAAPPEVKPVPVSSPEPVHAKRPGQAKKPPVKTKTKAVPPPKKVPSTPKIVTMTQADKDVALLAAVVTRTKAAQAQPSLLAVKWKQCATAKSVAAARQCREQLCASRAAGLPECVSGTSRLR